MGWFGRKPRDLIADSNAEWEEIRATEEQDHAIAQLERVVTANLANPGDSYRARPLDGALIAAGGWCAPSAPSFLDLPEIQIKRGGIKCPTSP